jgi:hypothetical protein
VLAAVLLLPATARANIGRQWWGDRAGEPLGLKGVAISREDLDIDLRPLVDLEPVQVSVIYRLHNSGPPRKLDLLFVSGSASVDDFEVRLGGQPVPCRRLAEKEVGKLPDSWKPHRLLPGVSGQEIYAPLHREPAEVAVVAFTVELPPGVSTLATRYRARACGTHEDHPTVTWQVPYILAPARDWNSFGELRVSVHVPEGWESASTPALERDGNRLRGKFTGLPGNALLLAARSPVGPEFQQAKSWYGGLYGLAVLGGGPLCWLVGLCQGWLLARRMGQRVGGASLLGIPSAVLWATAIVVAGWLALKGVTASLHGQHSPYFHEQFTLPAIGTLFLSLAVVPVGALLAWGALRLSLERAKERSARTGKVSGSVDVVERVRHEGRGESV